MIRKLESVSQFRHKKYFYTILKYKFNFIIVPKGLSRFQINLFHHKIAFLWAFLRGITKLGFHYTTFGLGLGYGGSPLTLKIIFLLSSFHSLLQRFDELKRILAIDVGHLFINTLDIKGHGFVFCLIMSKPRTPKSCKYEILYAYLNIKGIFDERKTLL